MLLRIQPAEYSYSSRDNFYMKMYITFFLIYFSKSGGALPHLPPAPPQPLPLREPCLSINDDVPLLDLCCSLKNTAKLRNHEIKQFQIDTTFYIFPAGKRLAEMFAFFVTQCFRLLCSKYWSLLLTLAGSNFSHFSGFLSDHI